MKDIHSAIEDIVKSLRGNVYGYKISFEHNTCIKPPVLNQHPDIWASSYVYFNYDIDDDYNKLVFKRDLKDYIIRREISLKILNKFKEDVQMYILKGEIMKFANDCYKHTYTMEKDGFWDNCDKLLDKDLIYRGGLKV